ncbi:hypothetical protein CQW39_20475 [Streptomyces griseofuscus]|nr:hypothetical protein CQW39_20475 [Streptomyces griseofuscus]
MRICGNSNDPLPSGYVITSEGPDSTCSQWYGETVNVASNGIAVCGNSPIPANYVITANFQVSSCGQYLGGRLNVAYNGIIACADSPTPPGYWVSANGIQSSACSPYQAERLNNS